MKIDEGLKYYLERRTNTLLERRIKYLQSICNSKNIINVLSDLRILGEGVVQYLYRVSMGSSQDYKPYNCLIFTGDEYADFADRYVRAVKFKPTDDEIKDAWNVSREFIKNTPINIIDCANKVRMYGNKGHHPEVLQELSNKQKEELVKTAFDRFIEMFKGVNQMLLEKRGQSTNSVFDKSSTAETVKIEIPNISNFSKAQEVNDSKLFTKDFIENNLLNDIEKKEQEVYWAKKKKRGENY